MSTLCTCREYVRWLPNDSRHVHARLDLATEAIAREGDTEEEASHTMAVGRETTKRREQKEEERIGDYGPY
uniref:Uncharacterized protein n=1 Tax=Oryza nivara TaxID=4536 RepID=A0A0E0FHC1_ORYNI